MDLLDAVPVAAADLTRLPEARQRRLFDAFHLQVRYNVRTGEIILHATIHADTAPALAAVVDAAVADGAVIDQVTDPLQSRHPHRFTGGGCGGCSVTRQQQTAGEADASPADDLCDALRAPGSVPTASQTTADPGSRQSPPAVIAHQGA